MATKAEEKYVVQPTAAPSNKVAAGGIGGAVATVLVVVIQMTTGAEFPVGFEAAVAVIVGFVVAYLTKESVQIESVEEK